MKLSNYLTKDSILFNLDVSSKEELLQAMCANIAKSETALNNDLSQESIYKSIIERENLDNTGVGNSIAFPHARLKSFNGVSLCIAQLSKPIDYGSLDGKQVHIVCMALIPESRPSYGIKILSTFSKIFLDMMKDDKLSFSSAEDIYNSIIDYDFTFEHSIKASEIMRKPIFKIHPEMLLNEATRIMAQYLANCAAVTDEEGNIVGELTAEKLLKIGVPEFFTQLKTVSFIREFDPFEKYFSKESYLRVKDVMDKPTSILTPDSTIMEIVFCTAVQKHEKIYIVEGTKLVGIIEKMLVIQKIINL